MTVVIQLVKKFNDCFMNPGILLPCYMLRYVKRISELCMWMTSALKLDVLRLLFSILFCRPSFASGPIILLSAPCSSFVLHVDISLKYLSKCTEHAGVHRRTTKKVSIKCFQSSAVIVFIQLTVCCFRYPYTSYDFYLLVYQYRFPRFTLP